MASLRDDFQHFYAPSEGAVAEALRTGLVAPDTNVLLSMYRFQSSARDDLFGALERLGDRLWVPYQVALEFHRNRLGVIDAQEKYFGATREELSSAVKAYIEKVKTFSGRIALTKERERELETAIRAVHKMVIDDVNKAEASNDVQLSALNSDEVLTRLEILLANKIDTPMSSCELAEARKEALRRAEAKIPPGYMDRAKSDPTGDYLVWVQLKQEAGRRKLPTVFITDDRKEDWYRREHGITLGARLELREEMQAEAGVPFLVMTTETFLLQARKFLDVAISPQTVDQAKDLPERIKHEVDALSLFLAREAAQRSEAAMTMLESEILATRERISAITDAMQQTIDGQDVEILVDEVRRKGEQHSELATLQRKLESLLVEHTYASEQVESQKLALAAAEQAVPSQPAASSRFQAMGEDERLQSGDHVYHRKFGKGIAISSNIKNGDLEYRISFEDQAYGTKIILPRYAPMIKL